MLGTTIPMSIIEGDYRRGQCFVESACSVTGVESSGLSPFGGELLAEKLSPIPVWYSCSFSHALPYYFCCEKGRTSRVIARCLCR